jgi:hypothetical protein
MANTLTKNVSQLVLKKFLPGFMSDLTLCETVDRQVIKGVINANTGSTVQLKRPHQYRSERTSGGDMTGKTASELISATATASVSDYITVFINWSQLEQAIELNQLDEILKPAREEMVTTLENELAEYMLKNAGLTNGVPSQAIDAWGDVAGTGSYLKALGVNGEMYAAMNPWSVQDLADAQNGLSSGSNDLVDSAWKRAQISKNFGGVMAFTSNALGSYTAGTAVDTTLTVDATPTATYTALKDTYQMSIALAGLAAGATLKAGQQLEFPGTLMLNQQNKNVLSKRNAGVPFVGTIMADATADGTGDVTVTISGAAIVDATYPQYNTVDAAITAGDDVKILATAGTTYQPGLAYTKGFVGLGTVELPKLEGWDSSVVNHKGFSIRATKSSDPITNVQALRLDLVPTFCCFNPMMGMQFFGNA